MIGGAGNPDMSGGDLALEERIAKLWAAELNLPAVGLDDNFFAIGGDSLAGVRVFLAVERAFAGPLPERALTAITTVREMAWLIEGALPEPAVEETEGRLTETERRALVAVMAMGGIPVARPGSPFKAANTGGSRPPLFWCFNSPEKEMRGLAPHLHPDQPFYGLFSGGRLYPKTEATMSKIAAFYAGEIVALFPDGPYVIGGNCRGSRVALRIARLLMESGRRVEKICFLEYSGESLESLHDFDGQLLLMYGDLSDQRPYRAIRWGAPGWREPFRRPPVVEWVSGMHGQLFQPYNAPSMGRKLDRFLRDLPRSSSIFANIESSIIMAIHKIPMLFSTYKNAFKLWNRVFYGKSVKVNSFTGEPMT